MESCDTMVRKNKINSTVMTTTNKFYSMKVNGNLDWHTEWESTTQKSTLTMMANGLKTSGQDLAPCMMNKE